MNTTKQPNRHSRGKQFRPLFQRLAKLRDRLKLSLQAYRREQRRRAQRRRKNPAGEQQLLALRKSLQFRWLQRWQQRRQYSQKDSRNFFALLWPSTGSGIDTSQAAALLLRNAAFALSLLILISLVLNAIPLQLGSPNWYLKVLSYIGENVPVLFLASGFALLSLAIGTNDHTSSTYRLKLLRVSRLGYLLALMLLPLQLGFTAWLFGQTYSSNRIQLMAFRANADALITGAQQTNSIGQFIAYLRSRNLTANLESIAAAPLVQVKLEFIRSAKANQLEQEQRLGAQFRSTLLRYITDSVKLFVTLLVLVGFMRGFQTLLRRCSLVELSTDQLASQAVNSISGSGD